MKKKIGRFGRLAFTILLFVAAALLFSRTYTAEHIEKKIAQITKQKVM